MKKEQIEFPHINSKSLETTTAATTTIKEDIISKNRNDSSNTDNIKHITAIVPLTLSVAVAVQAEGEGEVEIRYNHYKKKFKSINGTLLSNTIDGEYSISFAYPKSKIHLTLMGPSDFSYEEMGLIKRPQILEDPVGTYRGLKNDQIYWVEIEEDVLEHEIYNQKLRDEQQLKNTLLMKNECLDIDNENNNTLPFMISTKLESCSCIEGNPCIDSYCCKDFNNRYEIAKRNGWKGFQ